MSENKLKPTSIAKMKENNMDELEISTKIANLIKETNPELAPSIGEYRNEALYKIYLYILKIKAENDKANQKTS